MKMFQYIADFVLLTVPYWGVLVGALLLSLTLTPIVRSVNRKLGMVDIPSARRINKVPIPRGGGVAVIVATLVASSIFVLATGKEISHVSNQATFWRIMALSVGLGAIGFADDKFGLRPVVKLVGQLAIAFGAYLWAGVGFHQVFAVLPWWIDLPLTVFWITGAINAFNLIDGLDGLAAGLAVIAAVGMAGAQAFAGSPGQIFIHLALIGSLLGFLKYNFNPASVFLGDTGSMYLGFMLSTLPLLTGAGDSFLVSIGVPLLAMGVPVFDTSLAIVRRSVRAILSKEKNSDAEGNGKVMTADTDHLHHRLLRKFTSQKKTAFALYAMAAFLVLVGLGGIALRDKAAGLFIVAFMVAAVVVVRDMSRVELWDTGRLLDAVAHESPVKRKRWTAFLVPLYVFGDVSVLVVSWLLSIVVSIGPEMIPTNAFHTYLPIRIIPVFLALVLLRAYSTVWSRAQISNYLRLFAAVVVGAAISAATLYLLDLRHVGVKTSALIFALLSFLGLSAIRLVRNVVRDMFYILATRRMHDDPNATRTLVYGGGLRYRAFRRELVRRAAEGKRYICGIIDDDMLLNGHYIGGIRVDGPHTAAKRIIRSTGADEVVIAADLSPEKLDLVMRIFKENNVKVKLFSFVEKEL